MAELTLLLARAVPCLLLLAAGSAAGSPHAGTDSRNLFNGTLMVESGYLDQPYCDVVRASGRWVCTITGNAKPEGSSGEHVSALWSDDQGATWSTPVAVEPSPVNVELDNAYSMTLATPATGRVYTIYNMNLANTSTDGPGGPHISRTDMLGGFFMRYSEDQGATWSETRCVAAPPRVPRRPSGTAQGAVPCHANLHSTRAPLTRACHGGRPCPLAGTASPTA